jgi:predicted O-methyltransferase YrrM
MKKALARSTTKPVKHWRSVCHPIDRRRMLKLYSLFTPSHQVLKERFFEPTLPDDVKPHFRFFDNDGEGSIQDPSWRRAVIRKVEFILEVIECNRDEVFVFSDVDIQFFGSFAHWVPKTMAQYDLAFQIDAPGPALCTGFFFCRGNDITREVWTRALERMHETDAREDDQFTLRQLVWKTPGLRWTCLPPIFCGGGTLTGKHWQPGSALPLPRGLLMHHANFTCGVGNKIQQCEFVREQLASGNLMERDDAYRLTGFKEQFGEEVNWVNGCGESLITTVDYTAILNEMAKEPDFYPYASEPETGDFLRALIGLLRPRSVLELGTHKGYGTVHLARALEGQPRARLVTIDRCDQRSPQLRALNGAYIFIEGHDLEIIPGLPGQFDLVYIDTTHRLEHTVAEINALHAHSPRAVLVLHDAISSPAVAEAISKFTNSYDVMVLPTPPHPTMKWVNGLAVLSPKCR